jgi:nitrate reductase assembly molybdenum cofactor insertion protein NarJ
MSQVTHSQYENICFTLAELLSHPEVECACLVARLDASPLPRSSRKMLSAFHEATRELTLAEQEELYTRTFDLSPLISPALSVHLFGAESFKRSHLMVGLLDMYRDAGFDAQSEIADHMATVTRFLPHAPAQERKEIVQFILIPALSKMAELLNSKQNAYGHLLEAINEAVAAIETSEVAYA